MQGPYERVGRNASRCEGEWYPEQATLRELGQFVVKMTIEMRTNSSDFLPPPFAKRTFCNGLFRVVFSQTQVPVCGTESVFPDGIANRQRFKRLWGEEAGPGVNIERILRPSLAGCTVVDIDGRAEEGEGEFEEEAEENGWRLEHVYGIHVEEGGQARERGGQSIWDEFL